MDEASLGSTAGSVPRSPLPSLLAHPVVGIAAVILCAVVPHVRKLFLDFPTLFSGYLPDDAFYYYKTAINLRNGLGPTFDGQNWTNGFHPLWMAICTLVAYLTTAPSLYLRIIIFTNLAFVVVFSLAMYRLLEKELGRAFALLAVFVVNCSYPGSTAVFSGLETPLYLALLMLAIARADEGRELAGHAGRALALGVFFALTFFARTDFVMLAPWVLLLLLVRQRRLSGLGPAIRSILIACGVALAVAAPYLLYNFAHTGHFEQLSGLVKDLRGGQALPRAILGSLRGFAWGIRTHFLPVDVILIGLLALSALRLRPEALLRNPRLTVLSGMGVTVFAYYVVSYRESARDWHFAVAYVAAAALLVNALRIGTGALSQRVPRARRVLPLALSLLLVAAVAAKEVRQERKLQAGTYHFRVNVPYQDLAAKWIAANTPTGARIGSWNAGYVGFFSNRSVVNLDGLINGPVLYRYLREDDGVWRYILDQHLDYVSDYYFGEPLPPHSPIGPFLTLVHNVGPTEVNDRSGAKTIVDWYVWKVQYFASPSGTVRLPQQP